ncbi:hypothetical protein [Methanogenium cariaci]|uniref:hypothetical protein n=1 Tax=Methanogenium cariaci TaxID=2197 RepID=UPI0012F66351|nr:hypothetical protein [Methanogenium cariaci]
MVIIPPSDEFTDASFTLGGRVVVPHLPAGAVDVRMVTDRSVIFSGSVAPP